MAKKEKEALLESEGAADTEHTEPRVYELGFHIDPELSNEDVKKTYEGLKTVISSAGPIVAEGQPEKIALAYTISRGETAGRRDFNTAFFAWIAYEATGEGHEKVLAAAKAQTRIVRFLDIRTEKDAAKHSAEMHELMMQAAAANNSDEGPEIEEVSDVELDAALKEAGAGVS